MVRREASIFIVDDDDAVLDSLKVLLESLDFNVETYNSGQDFLSTYRSGGAACLVYDLRMPDVSGLEIIDRLAEQGSRLPVIIITAGGDVSLAVKAMKSGALDFVEKPFEESEILASIERALKLSREAQLEATEREDAREALARLTARERDVLDLLIVGCSNKSIASELGISPRTVEVHRARVIEKMGARSLPHLMRIALAAGVAPREIEVEREAGQS
ncbi:MAG: response regulator [Kiloniellales bacterium]|nr:response regulator [Kiloniellales bacterium]